MILDTFDWAEMYEGVPRISGDDPKDKTLDWSLYECSPHKRG